VPGPVPKRSDQRRRRNKVDLDRVQIDTEVLVPELNLPGDLHPVAVDFYESLRISGQAQYFEPSDWQRARVFVSLLSDVLYSSKPSSMMYAALQSDMQALLVSEGDRRKVRMEIDRLPADTSVEDAKVAQMNRYRRVASGD
jgi:hypothetical protein